MIGQDKSNLLLPGIPMTNLTADSLHAALASKRVNYRTEALATDGAS